MKKGYNYLEDLTSDVMFEAFGQTLEQVLEVSAEAMFAVIDKIEPKESLFIKAAAGDEKQLLYEFLSNLLTDSEIEGLFLSRFTVKSIKADKGLTLTAEAFGERMSPAKGGTVVKGVTYYGLKLDKTGDGYRAQVAMDI